MAGNDINANLAPNEIYISSHVRGVTITGNYINTAGEASNAVNGINFNLGAQDITGLVITGNELAHSGSAPTSAGIIFTSFGAASGVIVRGNWISEYARTSGTALNLGGLKFSESDFSGNSFNNNTVTINAAGNASTGVFPAGTTAEAGSRIILPNNKYLAGQNAAASDSYGLIRMTAANSVEVDVNGLGTILKGGAGKLLSSTTAPVISSGFGTTPSIAAHNGTAAFRINVGTGGSASTGVIGLPTATTGWNCYAQNLSSNTASVFLTKQTASSTTAATIGNYDAAGAAAAWTASDILAVSCFGL